MKKDDKKPLCLPKCLWWKIIGLMWRAIRLCWSWQSSMNSFHCSNKSGPQVSHLCISKASEIKCWNVNTKSINFFNHVSSGTLHMTKSVHSLHWGKNTEAAVALAWNFVEIFIVPTDWISFHCHEQTNFKWMKERLLEECMLHTRWILMTLGTLWF